MAITSQVLIEFREARNKLMELEADMSETVRRHQQAMETEEFNQSRLQVLAVRRTQEALGEFITAHTPKAG